MPKTPAPKLTLPALLTQVRACRLCEPHLPLGAAPLLQAGAQARILIVGQAPGRRAHESGVPFSDPSGDRLRDWLGVDSETFYDPQKIALLPMGFCFPGSGPTGDAPPRPECAPAWRKQLLAQLPHIELTVVIGRYAADWHIPGAAGKPMADVVADWERHWPKLLPAPHPSPRNQRWLRNNPWFAERLLPLLRKRVKELLG
ncbi:MAG TPA: uracil-DNA glycosylase family protein [Terracidiphilus sp.]|nr:uracil-DNA glycosylase family protein [Terracidiphilus sp.]